MLEYLGHLQIFRDTEEEVRVRSKSVRGVWRGRGWEEEGVGGSGPEDKMVMAGLGGTCVCQPNASAEEESVLHHAIWQ